jgi:hypothetical protein
MFVATCIGLSVHLIRSALKERYVCVDVIGVSVCLI